jgi:hypothetical protein
MFGSIAAWTGWSALKASMRWVLPLAAVVGVIAAFWMLVVAPRLELRQMEIKAQADQLQRTEDALKTVQSQVAAQREIDAEKAAATDETAAARTERVERTTIIREAAQARAEASGDPEVGAGLDAFLSDLRKEQGK